MTSGFARKFVAAVLSVTLVHQTVSVPRLRAGFWEDRQEARSLKASADVPPRSALSQAIPFGDRVLNAFAPAENILPRTASRKALPARLSGLSTAYAEVEDFNLAAGGSHPFVVLVQDVHNQVEVQRNMSRLLAELDRSYDLRLVGLEGAAGGFRHGLWRKVADPEDLSFAADFLLDRLLIGGAEHFALTAGSEPFLWGVESEESYIANVAAYRRAVPLEDAVKSYQERLGAVLADIRPKVFNPALAAVESGIDAYAAGTLGLAGHLESLSAVTGVEAKRYPQVRAFLDAHRLEKDVDFKTAEAERSRLVEALVKSATPAEVEGLVSASLEHRAGKMSFGDYYSRLKSLASRRGVDLDRTPSLRAYIDYALAADRVRKDALFDEIPALEAEAGDRLAVTAREKEVLSIVRDARQLDRLFHHRMTPQDWKLWRQRRDAAARLNDRLAALDFDVPALAFPGDLSVFEEFYEKALARNHDLLANFLAKAGPAGRGGKRAPVAVLVSGGFHTAGLRDLLAERKVSYAVLTPRLTRIDDAGDYLDVFSRGYTPLEKMLLGRTVFLQWQRGLSQRAMRGLDQFTEALSRTTAVLLLISSLVRGMAGGKDAAQSAAAAVQSHRPVAALELEGVETSGREIRVDLRAEGEAAFGVRLVPGGKADPAAPLSVQAGGVAATVVPLADRPSRAAARAVRVLAGVIAGAVLAFVGEAFWSAVTGQTAAAATIIGQARQAGESAAGGMDSLYHWVGGVIAVGGVFWSGVARLFRLRGRKKYIGTLLIVEDDPLVMRSLTKQAEKLDLDVVTAESLKEALEQIRIWRIDAVFSDGDLKDGLGKGLEFVEYLADRSKKGGGRIPVVFHSGRFTPEIETRLEALQSEGHLLSYFKKGSSQYHEDSLRNLIYAFKGVSPENVSLAKAYWEGKLVTSPIERPFRPSRQEDVEDLNRLDDAEMRRLERLALQSVADGEGVISMMVAGAASRMSTAEAPDEVRALVEGRKILSKAGVPVGTDPSGRVVTYLGAFASNLSRLFGGVEEEFSRAGRRSRVWENTVLLMSNDNYRPEHDRILSENANFGLKQGVQFYQQPLGVKFVGTPQEVEKLKKDLKTEQAYQQALARSQEAESRFRRTKDASELILSDERDPWGHGEALHQLVVSGKLLQILESGKKWISFRNVDNVAAKYDRQWLVSLGRFLDRGMDMQPEVSPRSPGQKGGSLIVMEDNGMHQLAEDPNIAETNRVKGTQVKPTDSYWFNDAVAILSPGFIAGLYRQEGQSLQEFIRELRDADAAALSAIAHRGREKFPKILDPKPAKQPGVNAVAVKPETNMWQSSGVAGADMKIQAVGVRGARNVDIETYKKLPWEERMKVLASLRFLGAKQWTKTPEALAEARGKLEKEVGRPLTDDEFLLTQETYFGNKILAQDMLRYVQEAPLFTPGIMGPGDGPKSRPLSDRPTRNGSNPPSSPSNPMLLFALPAVGALFGPWAALAFGAAAFGIAAWQVSLLWKKRASAPETRRDARLEEVVLSLSSTEELFGVPPALRGMVSTDGAGETVARLYSFFRGRPLSEADLAALKADRDLDFATVDEIARMTGDFRSLKEADTRTAGGLFGAHVGRMMEVAARAARENRLSPAALDALRAALLLERDDFSGGKSGSKEESAVALLLAETSSSLRKPFDPAAWKARAVSAPNANVLELPEDPAALRAFAEGDLAESLLRNEVLFFVSRGDVEQARKSLAQASAFAKDALAGKDLRALSHGFQSLLSLETRLIADPARLNALGMFDPGALYRRVADDPLLRQVRGVNVLFTAVDLAHWDRSSLPEELRDLVMFKMGSLQVEAYTQKAIEAIRWVLNFA